MEPDNFEVADRTPFELFRELARKMVKVLKEELNAELVKGKAWKIKPVAAERAA